MEIRAGKRKWRVFAYDVESHNDDESIAKQETSIWLSSFIDDETPLSEEAFFYDIPSFLDRLEEISCTKRSKRDEKKPIQNILIYVYNLSFEWSFLLPHLLERGFKWTPRISKDDEFSFSSVTRKSVSSVWVAELKFKKRGGFVQFRDMSKIFGGGLRKLAKNFGLPTQKGEIDYKLNRLHGHVVTDHEKEYCWKDTRILIDILLKIKEKGDKDFFNSTSAATYAAKKMISMGFTRSLRPVKAFRAYYPILGMEEDSFLRNSVSGGITYATPRWQFKDITQPIAHLDLHSAHPSSAYNHLFPYGDGEYFKGKPPADSRIKCVRIRVSYCGVKLHSVIALIGMDFIDDYEMTCWDFEIPTMRRCYNDLKVEYIEGYAYKRRALPWKEFYSTYYDMKKSAKGVDAYAYHQSKLYLNSSYGKLLERGHSENFENYISPSGAIDSIIHEKSEDEITLGGKYTYLGVGSAIPAWTRVTLINGALTIDPSGEKIVYFDTDSIFFIKDDQTMANAQKLDLEDHLGGWGWERDIVRGQFTAPKRYKIEEVDESGKVQLVPHLAGFNQFKTITKISDTLDGVKLDDETEDIPYDELNIVSSKYSVQRVKRVKGGTLVIMTEKEIDVQAKYQSIFDKNKV